LKAMFSKLALEKAKDIDGRMEYLFNFFQGKVMAWEQDGGPIVDETDEDGHITKEFKSFFSVNTDKQKYLFFILDYTENTINPDNVGLYALRVIKAENEETQFVSWQKMKIAGIYRPPVKGNN